MILLAISGSLRAASTNAALLEAAAHLAPPGTAVELYRDLRTIPPFDPDALGSGDALEDPLPPSVAALRDRLLAADGLVISSPEYAHGVSGVMKNALDWLVGSGELVGTPVAVINASATAVHAHAALVETLTVMNWDVVEAASITVPLASARLDAEAIATDPALAGPLAAAIAALVRRIEERAAPPTTFT